MALLTPLAAQVHALNDAREGRQTHTHVPTRTHMRPHTRGGNVGTRGPWGRGPWLSRPRAEAGYG